MIQYSLKTMSQNIKDIVRECALHFMNNEDSCTIEVDKIAKIKNATEKHILVFNIDNISYVNDKSIATMNSELLSHFIETKKQYKSTLNMRKKSGVCEFDDDFFYEKDWVETLGLQNFNKRELENIYYRFQDDVLTFEQQISLIRKDLSEEKTEIYVQAYREGFDVSDLINPELSVEKLKIILKAFRIGILAEELKPLVFANTSILQFNQAINSINYEISVNEIQEFVDSGFDQQYLIPKTTRDLIKSKIDTFCEEREMESSCFDINEIWIELKYCPDENKSLEEMIDDILEERFADLKKENELIL